jgi:hypothetical protein
MSTREWILSALFLAFLAVKVLEGALALDEWPLTNVSMFRDRHPPDDVPTRVRLWVDHGQGWLELRERDFLLSEDEFNLKLRGARDVESACKELIRIYARGARGKPRLLDAYAEREEIERPGVPRDIARMRFPCLPEADGGISPPRRG